MQKRREESDHDRLAHRFRLSHDSPLVDVESIPTTFASLSTEFGLDYVGAGLSVHRRPEYSAPFEYCISAKSTCPVATDHSGHGEAADTEKGARGVTGSVPVVRWSTFLHSNMASAANGSVADCIRL